MADSTKRLISLPQAADIGTPLEYEEVVPAFAPATPSTLPLPPVVEPEEAPVGTPATPKKEPVPV